MTGREPDLTRVCLMLPKHTFYHSHTPSIWAIHRFVPSAGCGSVLNVSNAPGLLLRLRLLAKDIKYRTSAILTHSSCKKLNIVSNGSIGDVEVELVESKSST